MKATLEQRLARLRLWALMSGDTVFYGQLMAGLKDEVGDVPSARTNGKRILWSRAWGDTLTTEQLRWVALHELLHCSQGHLWRFTPDDELANEACDEEINNWLLASPMARSGTIAPPDGMLCHDRFAGMPAEQIRNILASERRQPPPPPQPPDQPGQPGEPEDEGDGEGQGKGDGQDGGGEGQDGEGEGDGDGEGQPGQGKPGKGQGKGGQPGQGQDGEPDQDAPQTSQDGPGEAGEDGEGEDSGPGGKPGQGKPGPEPTYVDTCGSWEAPAQDASSGTDDDGQGQPSREDLAKEWQDRILQVSQASQAMPGQGSMPGNLDREVQRLTARPRIDWQAECIEFARNAISQRSDWTRSPRRYACQPVIYARRRANEVGSIVWVTDTSGSIGSDMLAAFRALGCSIQETLHCRLLAIDCDSRIRRQVWIEEGEELPQRAIGGGGTDFRPPVLRAAELAREGEQIAGIVYLTDLMGPEPTEQELEGIPILWVCVTPGSIAQTGRTVTVELGR